jgi:phage terminase small subunit
MRGRGPKSTRLKVLTGNPGKHPLNSHEPHPEVALPDCPPELGPVARGEWERMTAQLAPLRTLTHLDRAALASYCAAYALWTEASQLFRHTV